MICDGKKNNPFDLNLRNILPWMTQDLKYWTCREKVCIMLVYFLAWPCTVAYRIIEIQKPFIDFSTSRDNLWQTIEGIVMVVMTKYKYQPSWKYRSKSSADRREKELKSKEE